MLSADDNLGVGSFVTAGDDESGTPGTSEHFTSVDDVRAHLPAAYDLFAFSERDLSTDNYRLRPLRLPANRQFRVNAVARPAEHAATMPMGYGPR